MRLASGCNAANTMSPAPPSSSSRSRPHPARDSRTARRPMAPVRLAESREDDQGQRQPCLVQLLRRGVLRPPVLGGPVGLPAQTPQHDAGLADQTRITPHHRTPALGSSDFPRLLLGPRAAAAARPIWPPPWSARWLTRLAPARRSASTTQGKASTS